MAQYRRAALTHFHRTPIDPRGWQRSFARPLIAHERVRDPHDAQAMMGLLIAVPLGIACWAALAGAVMLVGSLVG